MKKTYKFKRILAGLMSLAMLSSLSSCKNDGQSSNESSAETVLTTVEPAPTDSSQPDSSESDIPVPVENPYKLDKSYKSLSCIELSGYPCVVSIGGGKLFVSVCNFDYENEDTNTTSAYIIDAVNDKILATKEFQQTWNPAGVTDKGVAFRNTSNGNVCFLADDLSVVDEYDNLNYDGVFSSDGACYYTVYDYNIYNLNLETGGYSMIETPKGVRFYSGISYASNDKILLYTVTYDDDYTNATAMVDMKSGTLEMLSDKIAGSTFTQNGFIAHTVCEDVDTGNSKLIYVDDDNCFAISNPDDAFYYMVPGADIVYYYDYIPTDLEDDTEYDGEFDGDYDGDYIGDFYPKYSAINIAKITDGKVFKAVQPFEDEGIQSFDSIYMSEEEILVLLCDDSEENYSLRLIDTKALDFDTEIETEPCETVITVDEDIISKLEEVAPPEIPGVRSDLQPLRDRADALENEYGIKIYISEQCGYIQNTGNDFTTTDDFFSADVEYDYINDALDCIEISLEKYPDGFFRQFKNRVDGCGIRILLTAEILDNFSAAYAYYGDYWYSMVFDVRFDMITNFPHEMWHTTENFINNKDWSILNETVWDSFNPTGFLYIGLDEYADNGTTLEYCYSFDDDFYFTRGYSKTNWLEDKATIMEWVMSTEYLDDYLCSPHICEKLEYMNDAVREAFDTTGWDNVLWEDVLAS